MKYLKSFGDIWNGIFLILHFLYYISLNLSIDATEPGLLSLSKELKFRLMMLGDVKQLGAVETGKPFHYLQEHGLNTVSMSTIKRQQNKELLKSVVLSESAVDAEMRDSKKLISKSLEVLGEKNILDLSKQSQNASRIYTNEDFARALYDKWKELNARGVTPLVIVPSNPMRLLVNAKIRTNGSVASIDKFSDI